MAASPATHRPLAMHAREDLVFAPLDVRGERYWTVKDPIALRYYQLRDEEFFLLQSLRGGSLASLQEQFEHQFAPQRISAGELQRFLTLLHREGLIVAETSGQGDAIREREHQSRRWRRWEWLANPLAIRFPGLNLTGLLEVAYRGGRWLFSPWALVAMTLLVVSAAVLTAVELDAFRHDLPRWHEFATARNALTLAVVLAAAKCLHEIGHALTCRHFGGRCHEVGLMLLVGAPCLYCNVSDAWLFPNRWSRIAVSAAGIGVELVLAAAAVWIWWWSNPGGVHSLAVQVALVCSVGTLLFNANPLLRFDGYYVLADWLGRPNLRQQARAWWGAWAKRWFLGLDEDASWVIPESGRLTLMAYGAAAYVYMLLVTGLVFWFLHGILAPLRLHGLLILAGGWWAASLVLAPAWRLAGVCRQPRRRGELSWRRMALTTGVCLLGVVGLALVPLPHFVSAPALTACAHARLVYVPVPGRIAATVRAGERVHTGQVLARLENSSIAQEMLRAQGDCDTQRLYVERLRRLAVIEQRADPAGAASQLPIAEARLADAERRLAQRQTEQSRLCLVSPGPGVVIPPRLAETTVLEAELTRWTGTPLDDRNRGALLEADTLLCEIGDPEQLELLAFVEQSRIRHLRTGLPVRVQLAAARGQRLRGEVREISRADRREFPLELVRQGWLPSAEQLLREPGLVYYQVRIALREPAGALPLRATGVARISAGSRNLGQRFWSFLTETFRVAAARQGIAMINPAAAKASMLPGTNRSRGR